MLSNIPWVYLIIAAVLLGLAPFGHTPHLVEKMQMLFNGNLRKPLDIFDLILHSAPIFLIIIKGIGQLRG